MPTDGPAIPLARWADRQLRVLAEVTGSQAIAALDGATITGERAVLGGFTIPGMISAGSGHSRLLPTRDGRWFVLTMTRSADRELLPALFGDGDLDIEDDNAIAAAVAARDCGELLAQGRALGLTVASNDELPASPPVELMAQGPHRIRTSVTPPLVIDLSAIWAGPLAGHLLWLAGAQVVKVESLARPDALRTLDANIFDVINQGKANVAADFSTAEGREALIALIRRADFVIESSRPRALLQLGIDADALVRETPGLVWLSVTGHGATGEAANWVGIGHDCGVAGGLTRALVAATGEPGFVGDALPDPLTGITVVLEGWRAFKRGEACRIGFSLSAIAATALAEERLFDAARLDAELRGWLAARGQPFPHVDLRAIIGEVRPLGADSAQWLRSC